jgi:ABC-type sulfate transport system permease component
MAEQPTSVTRAIRLLLGLIAAGLVVTVLVVVFRDDLEEAWSAGHPADSAIKPLEFVPVVITLYITVALLTLTLIPFFRSGHNWARHSLAAMVLVIAVHLFPFVILITPLYLFFSELRLLNTYQGLIIAYVAITLPFATYLMMGYFETVPKGLDEAARERANLAEYPVSLDRSRASQSFSFVSGRRAFSVTTIHGVVPS